MTLKSKTILTITSCLSISVLLLSLSTYYLFAENNYRNISNLSQALVKNIFSLSMLSQDFFLTNSQRPMQQFKHIQSDTHKITEQLRLQAPSLETDIARIGKQMQRINIAFETLQKTNTDQSNQTSRQIKFIESDLIIRLNAIVSISNQIYKRSNRNYIKYHHAAITLFSLYVALTLIFFGLFSRLMWSSVISPIAALIKKVELGQGRRKQILQSNDELEALDKAYTSLFVKLDKAHDDLKNSTQTLIQAEKVNTLGTFVAGVAHELNNPLAGILMYADILVDMHKDEKSQEYLMIVKKEITRSINIIKNLLSFSHKRDTQDFNLESVTSLIHASLSLLNFKIDRSGCELVLDLPKEEVKADINAQQIEQVIINLITNAIDALADKKQKAITLTLEDNDDSIEIRIADNGAGVPKKIMNNIFEPFFTTKKTGEGTGLGLSIVATIIKEHSGTIDVASEEDKGTTFMIRLPKHHKRSS